MDTATGPLTGTYQRHQPEHSLLYQVLAEHLETFLQQVRTSDHVLPWYVERDLRAFLDCGLLQHGFLRLRCPQCNTSRVVPFSCKRRTFCPSCMGRRMADTAARLVDQVFPRVPVRQWVISFPIEIRYRLAYDGALLSALLRTFLQHLEAYYRGQARQLGYRHARSGGVTCVQRFGSALNLNPHLHILMLDGVYVSHPDSGQPTFVPVPPPTDDQIQHLIEQAAVRLIQQLEQRGVLDDTDADALTQQQPVLSGLTAASVQGTQALGPQAGQRLRRLLTDPAMGQRTAPLCFAARGFSLHAATIVAADDRDGLERLARYVNRPPLAYGRLQQLDHGDLAFALKTPWDNGTTHLVFTPLEFIGRLAALTPPPRLHLIRYHGVLAPHAADRALIVPGARQPLPDHDQPSTSATPEPRSRLLWATLLARVFLADAEKCPRCGARMQWVAALTDPDSIRAYLTGVGLAAEPPDIAPPRPPPQHELEFSG
jgi:hypothetical protein